MMATSESDGRSGRLVTRGNRTMLLAWVGLGLALGAAIAPAGAQIIVTNNADYAFGVGPVNGDGTACTLRKAMTNVFDGAQTFTDCQAPTPGADVITFSNASTITLGTIGALPFVNNVLTITGPKTIAGISSGFGAAEIFHIAASPGALTLNSITLNNAGNSAIRMDGGSLTMAAGAFNNNTTGACCGGAIGGTGTIALADVIFTGNTAPSGSGGAINLTTTGSNSITGSSFLNNSAHNSGGAIYFSASTSLATSTTITNGIFTSNTASATGGATEGGGAIYTSTSNLAQLSIINPAFLLNTAGTDGRGGAIYNANSDTVSVLDHGFFTQNSVSGANSMGGAIYTRYQMVVRASSFIQNSANSGVGGAIASDSPPPDNVAFPPKPGMIVGNSTFQGNSASQGGGVYSFGQGTAREIKLINVTMDGNTASAAAGGGSMTTGQGLTRLANTIVSNNTANAAGDNCDGTAVNNVATNLQWPATTCASDTLITSLNPKLNSATINLPDVLTLTMSLQAGSAASNTGTNSVCSAFPIFNLDQRSLIAPIRPLGGPNCDIGAYESSICAYGDENARVHAILRACHWWCSPI